MSYIEAVIFLSNVSIRYENTDNFCTIWEYPKTKKVYRFGIPMNEMWEEV